MSAKAVIMNKELSFRIGQIIADLHIGLKSIESQHEFYDNNFLEELNSWIRKNIDDKSEDLFVENILDDCISRMEAIYPHLKRQPIHRDVHLENMIFDGNNVTGYIDFDISQINVRIFDIAYMGAGSLAEIFDDVEVRDEWCEFLFKLIDGYNSVTQLDSGEAESIWIMIASIEILFIGYFLSIDNGKLAKSTDNILKWIWENHLLTK